MNAALDRLSAQAWIAHAGWTLLHFLWQGALIAILFAAVRALAGGSLTAQARYRLACSTLATMTILPLLTYFAMDRDISVIAPAWRPTPDALQSALPSVVAVWLCGTIVFSLRLLRAWRSTKILRTVAVTPAPPEWQAQLDDLIRRIGVSRPVRLLVSSLADVPIVIGWLRPVVLMPVGALAGLPLDQVEALLAHELAHVWRNDYLINLLQSVAEAMLFYHPAVWWVSSQIRIERESCCDDVAVNASGGVAVYVRALADLETSRRARLKTALAADGGLQSGALLSRVRRLMAEPQPVASNLPAAGAAWALSLLWLAAIGAATVHGAPAPLPHAIPPKAAAQVATPAVPLVNALLFDPFFDPPQASAPAPSRPPGTGGMRASQVDLVYIPGPVDPPKQPLVFSGAGWVLPPASAFSQIYDDTLNSGDPISITVNGPSAVLSTTCPIACAEFETWVEGLSGDYVESIYSNLGSVEREAGKTTLQRFVGDDKRHVYITYKAIVEPLPEPGAYRVAFADSEPAVPVWPRPPANSKITSPLNTLLPQIVREGETLAITLYADSQTGQKLVDYIHFGHREPIVLRTATARDAYADHAVFTFVHPRLSVNGVGQESRPETIQGPVLWVYIPGHGRILLSFQPRPELGFAAAGEVTAGSLTFSIGQNLFQIDGAERIASPGSGTYRVYALQDSAWKPADPADRAHFMIGSAPAIETAGGENNRGDLINMLNVRATAIRSGLLALTLNAAYSQAQTKLEFEVAAVRPEGPQAGPPMKGVRGGPGSPDPTRISYMSVSMMGLLTMAYDLPMDQIAGPSWIATERYSIDAKVPPGTTREQLNVMLQNLLAERFHLTSHLAKKEFEAYEMTVAKGGLKMKESANASAGPAPPLDRDAMLQAARTPLTFKDGFPVLPPGERPALTGIGVNGRVLTSARQQDMEAIVRTLQGPLGPGARIVDKTGLTAKYDFHFQFAIPQSPTAVANPGPPGSDYLDSIGEPAPDLIQAAQEQLGLHLEKRKVSIDVLTIDHLDKMPTAN